MSGETESNVSGWTVDTLAYHQRVSDNWRDRFEFERDRRYAEVALEREKALKIKETADLAALQLAREIQTYKDEKANELREQINRERGLYATKADVLASVEKQEAIVKPLADYVTSRQGRDAGVQMSTGVMVTIVTLAILALGLILTLMNYITR